MNRGLVIAGDDGTDCVVAVVVVVVVVVVVCMSTIGIFVLYLVTCILGLSSTTDVRDEVHADL